MACIKLFSLVAARKCQKRIALLPSYVGEEVAHWLVLWTPEQALRVKALSEAIIRKCCDLGKDTFTLVVLNPTYSAGFGECNAISFHASGFL